MSRTLAELLDRSEQSVHELVMSLEKLSGYPGVDVRLMLEIDKVSTAKIRSLGLDPADCTADELYHALLSRFTADEQRFTRLIGARTHHGHSEITPQLIKKLNGLKTPRLAWVVKRSVMRQILKTNPPKALMKHLGYRTSDSLIKREAVEEILAASPFTESASWTKSLKKAYGKLMPSDFEVRDVEIVAMGAERWGKLPRSGSIVGWQPQLGSVIVWPSADETGHALALAALVAEAIQGVRIFCAWLEFCRVRPDFPKHLIKVYEQGTEPLVGIGGQTIDWRSLLVHFGLLRANDWPAAFEGRIKVEDGLMSLPEADLCMIDSNLSWWLGTGFVGRRVDSQIISFNLSDVAVNFANQLNMRGSSTTWLEEKLADQLAGRYLLNPWVETELLGQLEGQD